MANQIIAQGYIGSNMIVTQGYSIGAVLLKIRVYMDELHKLSMTHSELNKLFQKAKDLSKIKMKGETV